MIDQTTILDLSYTVAPATTCLNDRAYRVPIFRQLWIGLIAIPLCIAIAVAITAAFGPLFGAWD